jgi:hypothetical protein
MAICARALARQNELRARALDKKTREQANWRFFSFFIVYIYAHARIRIFVGFFFFFSPTTIA